MNNMGQDEIALMLEMIMNGQQNSAEDDILNKQYAEAQAIRGPDRLEMGGNGRIMTAPTGLELLGGLAQNAVGGMKRNEVAGKKRAQATKVGGQNQRIMDALMQMMQKNQQPQPTPVQPGMPQGMNPAQPNGLGLKMPQGGEMPQPPGLQANSGMVPPFQM